MSLTWDRLSLTFKDTSNRAVRQEVVKAGAQAVVQESRFQIHHQSLMLQQGRISADEWEAALRHTTKVQAAAQVALARGGWAEMRESDWQHAGDLTDRQWTFLRGFGDDVVRGRYGPTLEAGNFLDRAGMYADAGRAMYENERTLLHKENNYDQAKRIRGAVDSCPGCIEAADEEWTGIDDVLPIGAAECRTACHCTTIYRRSAE